MAYDKWKIEGGQGGKLGHSNMAHWDYTEWIKVCSNKNRRMQSRQMTGDIQLDDEEIEITLTLADNLDETDRDQFNIEFIEEMERQKLLFGGGIDKHSLKGCIDRTSSNLSEIELIELLEDLCTNKFGQVVEMKINTLPNTH